MTFNDSFSSDHVSETFTKELQHISVRVEHVDDEEGMQVKPVDDQENEVADNDAHDDVQHSPPIL
jgi:hypothetical protein